MESGFGESIPLDWANTKAAYRFFSNDRMSEEDILRGHFGATRRRFAASDGPILILHDTTESGLSLHRDKTRLVEFGRFAVMNCCQRGVGKPETFDFLGFTHYCTMDDPARTLSAWSQTGRQTGQQDPGAHRRGGSQALAPRHLGGR